MTPLTRLRRKIDKAIDAGRGIALDAEETLAFDEVVGQLIREHADHELNPYDFPPRPAQPVVRWDRWVYFVQEGDCGPIKIGTSAQVAPRVRDLQVAQPRLLHTRAATKLYEECELHRFYKRERIRGEWFRPSPRLLAFIRSLQA